MLSCGHGIFGAVDPPNRLTKSTSVTGQLGFCDQPRRTKPLGEPGFYFELNPVKYNQSISPYVALE